MKSESKQFPVSISLSLCSSQRVLLKGNNIHIFLFHSTPLGSKNKSAKTLWTFNECCLMMTIVKKADRISTRGGVLLIK